MSEILNFSSEEIIYPQDLKTTLKEMIINKQRSVLLKPTVLQDKDFSIQLTQDLEQDSENQTKYSWKFAGSLVADENHQHLPGVRFVLRFTLQEPFDALTEIPSSGYYENETANQKNQFMGVVSLFLPIDDALAQVIADTTGKSVKRTVVTSFQKGNKFFEEQGYEHTPLSKPTVSELEKVYRPSSDEPFITDVQQITGEE
jgi:hypothetical protein